VARQAPKGRAPARERRQTRADEQRARRAEQLEGFRSEQEHHAAILLGDHPIGLEPGHDPTLQRRYRELDEGIAEALEETAGEDNQPPGANRVTTVPAEAGDDDSVTPESVRGAKDEADAKREEARAGK
jgi:hypothetical protein